METLIALRDYQKEAVQAVLDLWTIHPHSKTLIIAPTGSGKSLMIAALVQAFPEKRICLLTHRAELIAQNAQTLKRFTGIDAGIYSASLGSKERYERVTFAGIQSIGKKSSDFEAFSLILIDEAHLLPPTETTLYRTFLDAALQKSPSTKIVGLTATPYRLDSGLLTEGKNPLFDSIAYEIEIPDLIEKGYLCPVVSKAGVKSIDTSSVHIRGGEYMPAELAMAAGDKELTTKAVAEIVKYGVNRKGWILFCSGIEHAENILSELKMWGIAAGIVTGETPFDERTAILTAYKKGEVRALCNVNVLTVGFDAPHTDLIAMLRPTKSTALFIQCVGRGMRPCTGKENLLLLDYAGVVKEHGLIDAVDPKRNGGSAGKEEECPVKACPACRTFVPNATRICPECGHKWPQREIIHGVQAYSGAVLSSQIEVTAIDVKSVHLSRHKKAGKPDSLRITYITLGGRRISEWLFPEAIDWRRRKFEKRCREEWGLLLSEIPLRIDGVLALHPPIPSQIVVDDSGEWPDVKRRIYA